MMASKLRMKLTNMKEEEGSSRQKEEANIVLQVLWKPTFFVMIFVRS